ncbi:30256_t:CDS:2, partial [Racocetra persica]
SLIFCLRRSLQRFKVRQGRSRIIDVKDINDSGTLNHHELRFDQISMLCQDWVIIQDL